MIPSTSARWLVAALLAGILIAAWPAVSRGDPEGVIRQRQSELTDLKAKIEERKRRIAQLRSQGEDLGKILAELERQRATTTRYITVLDEQVAALEHDLTTHRGNLQLKTFELGRTREELAQSLVRYYKRGRADAAELMLSSRSFGAIFARSHYWIRTIHKLRERIGAVALQSTEIVGELTDTEQRRQAVLDLRREREDRLRELDGQEAQRQRDRLELQGTISRY